MVQKLAQIPLAFDPGTDWVYGVAIDVLGRVIEVAGGMGLDRFLEEHIFQPLNMPDTSFSVPMEKHEVALPSITADHLRVFGH